MRGKTVPRLVTVMDDLGGGGGMALPLLPLLVVVVELVVVTVLKLLLSLLFAELKDRLLDSLVPPEVRSNWTDLLLGFNLRRSRFVFCGVMGSGDAINKDDDDDEDDDEGHGRQSFDFVFCSADTSLSCLASRVHMRQKLDDWACWAA